MKGTSHTVKSGEDLPYLAGIYYGQPELWSAIYWANLDIYEDDPEKIPTGNEIFIPDVQTEPRRVRLKADVRSQRIEKEPAGTQLGGAFAVAPQIGLPEARGTPYQFKNRTRVRGEGFVITEDEYGYKRLIFVWPGETGVKSKRLSIGRCYPGALGDTAEALGVSDGEVSNSLARGINGATALKEPGVIGEPLSAPLDSDFNGTVDDLIREATIALYGHDYMYYQVLLYNKMKEVEVQRPGTYVNMPGRGRRSLLRRAEDLRKEMELIE